MQLQTKKLNKMTIFKAMAALIVIVTVLMVGLICTVFAATSAANSGALGAYESWGKKLSEDVMSSADEQGLTISDSLTDAEKASLFAGEYGFEGVALITSSGLVLYDSNGESGVFGQYIPKGIEMSHEETTVGVASLGKKSYAIAVSNVGGEYYAVGYIDFTASALALAELRKSAVAIGVITSLFVILAFVVYTIATGLNERGHLYKYKLLTDGEGRILRANDAFKEDFPQTIRLYENVSRFSDNRLTAIKIPCFDDEVFVGCAAKKTKDGNVKLSADPLTMPYNSQATQPRDMMRETYTNFMLKSRHLLIGVINLADLPNIYEMFGQEFAKSVHSVLYERISKRFTYMYDLDLYNIGVLFPDGKEYKILMEDLREIVDGYNEPLKIEENILNAKIKCGFAICDNNLAERSYEYAMTAADAALRRASQDPLKDFYVFHGTDIKSYAKFFFHYDIRQMLENKMFEMEYQPQYSIKEGRVVGFEALFRVKKQANVFVNIFDLISYAERSGYMLFLSEFIFDTAMRFAKKVENKNVTVSINLSPVQIMQAGFCESFLEIYDRYNLRDGVICVEITESFLVKNFDYVTKKLDILHEHGIEVHLDDFGTRYSSLLYLKKIPAKVLKIDREFVIDITENDMDRSITEMIINLCKRHNMLSIAEGVETREQYDALKEMGVDIIQGWLIGKSLPADDANRFIDEFKFK